MNKFCIFHEIMQYMMDLHSIARSEAIIEDLRTYIRENNIIAVKGVKDCGKSTFISDIAGYDSLIIAQSINEIGFFNGRTSCPNVTTVYDITSKLNTDYVLNFDSIYLDSCYKPEHLVSAIVENLVRNNNSKTIVYVIG